MPLVRISEDTKANDAARETMLAAVFTLSQPVLSAPQEH